MVLIRQVALLFTLSFSLVHGGDFLGSRSETDAAHIRSVIHDALNGMLGGGHGVDAARLASINATLAPIFNVLPKQNRDRLSAAFFRYAIRRYFSQRHSWMVKGFEPQQGNTSTAGDPQSVPVMDKVPGYVKDIIEHKLSHGGFQLQDMVTAVAAMEALIFDDVVKGVETAYSLNSLDTARPINKHPNASGVFMSYFINEHLWGNSTHIAQHMAQKKNIDRFYPHWKETAVFMRDIIQEYQWLDKPASNPFVVKRSFSFDEVARISRVISERFGTFSNHECHEMKLKLAEMDKYGTGRVKISDFYKSGQNGAWQFLETAEYLTAIGALDTSSEQLGPQVIIPNYISGSNNCISSSLYYDICCLNECDGIYQHLEARINGPTASAAEVIKALEEGITLSPLLSSTAPTEPRNLSASVKDMLQQVADHHKNVIPLHGRLFAQFLHYAFPHECPYPHVTGMAWETLADLKKRDAKLSVTDDDVHQFLNSSVANSEPSPHAGLDMWILHEELLKTSDSAPGVTSSGLSLRTAIHVVGLASFAVVLLKELGRVARITGLHTGARDVKTVEYDI